MKELSTQEIAGIYSSLAKEYSARKKESMLNLLYCGRLLYNAKKNLPHGMFANFLADSRVAESERTAQRLMSVYRNFGHLIVDSDLKLSALDRLGVSHLLELQKLPARFRKQVEMEVDIHGEKVTEEMEVIDEDKLNDFLEKSVKFQGETKHIRELPVEELKRYINEAAGVYVPTKEQSDEEMVENTDSFSEEVSSSEVLSSFEPRINGAILPVASDDEAIIDTMDSVAQEKEVFIESLVNKFRTRLSDLSMELNDLKSKKEQICAHREFEDMDSRIRSGFKGDVNSIKDRLETLIVSLIDLEERL